MGFLFRSFGKELFFSLILVGIVKFVDSWRDKDILSMLKSDGERDLLSPRAKSSVYEDGMVVVRYVDCIAWMPKLYMRGFYSVYISEEKDGG